MKKIFNLLGFILIIVLFSSFSLGEVVIVNNIEFLEGGRITMSDTYLDYGSKTSFEGDYTMTFLSNGKIVSESSFSKEQAVSSDNSSRIVKVKSNYLETIDTLRIMGGGLILYEKEFDLCNSDDVCNYESGENYLSCESDCVSGSKDNLCDAIEDGICDPDCPTNEKFNGDIDCNPSSSGENRLILILFLVVLILAVVFALVFIVKKRKAKVSKE